MNELERICLGYRILVGRAEPAYLATLVGADRPLSRQPGARMLFTQREVVAGSLGTTHGEAEVVRRGPWLLRTERAQLMPLQNGSVRVLLECLGPRTPGPLPLVEGCLREERSGALATVIAADHRLNLLGARVQVGPDAGVPSACLDAELRERLLEAARRTLTNGSCGSERIGDVEAFVEALEPPPHLFVFGSGSAVPAGATPAAPTVVTLAHSLGWRVTYCDSTGLCSARDRFPRNAAVLEGSLSQAVEHLNRAARPLAVVMSEHRDADANALGALLASRALYVGLLGPTRRPQHLLADLGTKAGAAAASLASTRAARTRAVRRPADCALSIVAEAQAALSRSCGQVVSSRRPAVHPALGCVGGVP
jgi:xanthine dehydrogenase accessory factor